MLEMASIIIFPLVQFSKALWVMAVLHILLPLVLLFPRSARLPAGTRATNLWFPPNNLF